MNNQIELKVKGYIKIYRNGELIHEQPNTLTSNAYEVLRRTIVGDTGYINKINVYKLGGLLASSNITQKTYFATNKIQVISIFDEASFDDTFDEMRLYGDTYIFSEVIGLSIAKDNLSQIAIEWTLEFIITGIAP